MSSYFEHFLIEDYPDKYRMYEFHTESMKFNLLLLLVALYRDSIGVSIQ